MPQLETISIKGYKSIREMALRLRPLNILIGANGAGKSNFISAFLFLNELMNENLTLHVARNGGVDVFLYYGQKTTDELFFRVDFAPTRANENNAYACTLIPSANDVFVFEDENAYFHDQRLYPEPYNVYLGSGHTETQIPYKARDQAVVRYVRNAMKSWRIYHFHDTSESARIKQTGDVDDNRFLRADASNLAAYLYRLHQTHRAHYDNIVDTIRLIAPFFGDFNLRPSPLNPDKIRLEWSEKGSDMYFNAHSLSDGTLRFISLATLLLQPSPHLPTTILLDEPELGLHPYAISVLAGLLQSAAERTQVIVSTQSVTLVNQFSHEDIIIVERDDRQSVFRHLPDDKVDQWLDDYGLGDLWEKNVLGGRPAA